MVEMPCSLASAHATCGTPPTSAIVGSVAGASESTLRVNVGDQLAPSNDAACTVALPEFSNSCQVTHSVAPTAAAPVTATLASASAFAGDATLSQPDPVRRATAIVLR